MYRDHHPAKRSEKPRIPAKISEPLKKAVEKVVDERQKGEKPLAGLIPEDVKEKLPKKLTAEEQFMKGVRQMFFLNLST